jgi:hypothetical protein
MHLQESKDFINVVTNQQSVPDNLKGKMSSQIYIPLINGDKLEFEEGLNSDIDDLDAHDNDFLVKIDNKNKTIKKHPKNHTCDSISFGSKIDGPHADGGCQNSSLISIPDMMKKGNYKPKK